MNTELFGELHEQEENGLFGNELNELIEREVALRIHDVVGQSEQLVCSCGCKKVKTNSDYE